MAAEVKEGSPQPQLIGVMLSVESSKNCRFDSSGLNPAFEGLLLEASLRLQIKATSSNPRKSNSESAT
jgi:hypothetical protein